MNHPARTALVTGSNRGIGLAIAQALAALPGYRVLAAARTEATARQAAAEIGNGAQGVELDLSQPAAAAAAARAVEEQHGPIDVLVNNAAILVPGKGLEASLEGLEESLAVNVAAPFALIHALAPGMQARGYGRIVNLSSGWGSFDEGLAGPLAYSVSKAALNALTLSLAASLAPAVKINAVCPGWVRTRMGGEAADRSPQEGAETPVWLATLPEDGPTGGFFRDRRLIEW
ncbi:MAG: SDR family NAD(P)-dependent oxidoreductase [Acidobacteriota bacterium]